MSSLISVLQPITMQKIFIIIIISLLCSKLGVAGTSTKKCTTIKLISTNAADNITSNNILNHLYTNLGYDIETVRAETSEDAYALLNEQTADIYLSTWMPLDKESLKPYALEGTVKTLNQTLSNAAIGLATNLFGKNKHLTSLKQLAQFGQSLDYTIYVSQSDWLFAQKIQHVIDSNIYGLEKFQIKRVHNFDFKEYLSIAKENKKPIVFFTRKPSFLAFDHAASFLTDPLDFFKDFQTQAASYASVRYDFPKSCSNAGKLLKNFTLDSKEHTEILSLAQGSPLKIKAAVDTYLKKHPELIEQWLKNVQSLDGQAALDSWKKNTLPSGV